MSENKAQWRFFRAGGFEQIVLNNADDLINLKQLDQKLWATLACPVDNLAIDKAMLGYLDVNNDGRIRAPEVVAAIDWLLERLATAEVLFQSRPLQLSDFSENAAGLHLKMSAQRLLQIKGKDAAGGLTRADSADLAALFPPDQPNGDGLIPVALASDPALAETIALIIDTLGGEQDRSGEKAISAAQIEAFYQQIAALKEWYNSVEASTLQPFGEHTDAAIQLIAQLRDKINDYFTRVALVAYDARNSAIMASQEDQLQRLSALSLADTSPLLDLPLAGMHYGQQLPLQEGLNPAWKAAMEQLYHSAIVPSFGEQTQLTQEQWHALLAKSQAYFAWQAAKPQGEVASKLSLEQVKALESSNQQAALLDLVQQDLAVAEASDGLVDLDKLLSYQESLITLLRNFISFQNFYQRKERAIFQAGRLYIDGKSLDLVVQVEDIAKHSAVATNSESFLIYCECVRRGQPIDGKEKINIVAAVTAGIDHELMVGRNGLFYDRDGNDWDATVVKIIENAISVREAFWSPYRRISGLISSQIQKMAASRDQQLMQSAGTKLEGGGAAGEPSTFDIARFAGIFAAIGLALGALGTAAAAVMSGLMGLSWWQWPVLLIGIMAAISGPSMLLAWFKLRRRSLGPILDANGWAVNAQARISIPFGASLTQLAELPKGSKRGVKDPYQGRVARIFWLWLALMIGMGSLGYYLWAHYWL